MRYGLTKSEIEIIKDMDVKLSHNPSSNMKLSSGVSPVAELLGKGISVSLGTDGVASNNNMDHVGRDENCCSSSEGPNQGSNHYVCRGSF